MSRHRGGERRIVQLFQQHEESVSLVREGWYNFRTATPVFVREDEHTYYIYTSLYGMHGDTLAIWMDNDRLFVEGQVRYSPQGPPRLGRYVRYIPLEGAVDTRYLEAQYNVDGRLVVKLPKKNLSGRQ